MNSKVFSFVAAILIAIMTVLGGTYYYLFKYPMTLEPSPEISQNYGQSTQDPVQDISQPTDTSPTANEQTEEQNIFSSQEGSANDNEEQDSQVQETPLTREETSENEDSSGVENFSQSDRSDHQGEHSLENENQEQSGSNSESEGPIGDEPHPQEQSSTEEQSSIKEETQEAEHTSELRKPAERLSAIKEYQQRGKDSRLEPRLSSEFVKVYVMNGRILSDYRIDLFKDLLEPIQERSKDYNLSIFIEMLPKNEMSVTIYNKDIIFSDKKKSYRYITIDKLRPYLDKPWELNEKVKREEVIERINFEILVDAKGSDFSRHIKSLKSGLDAAQYFFPFCEIIQIDSRK